MKKIIALILLLLLTAGCRKANTEAPIMSATAGTALSTTAPAVEGSSAPAEYAFSFNAQTLDGETVTETFFSQYDLTMVNVWASWCPPCRGELSELGLLYGQLPENVGFLSVTLDDPGDLSDAQALLEEHGCTFPCLDGQASAGLMKGFLSRVMAIPTTVFFDSHGNQVGEWLVGVPQSSGAVSEAYLGEIQARLDLLTEK